MTGSITALDTLVHEALTAGRVPHHDAVPEDFGEEDGRGSLFRDCLITLLDRYPALRIEVSGSSLSLKKLSLNPGFLNPIGIHNVGVYCAPLTDPNAVRIHFIRKSMHVARSRFADVETEERRANVEAPRVLRLSVSALEQKCEECSGSC